MTFRFSITLCSFLLLNVSLAQVVPSRVYHLLKQESFDQAETYANNKIVEYKNDPKGYKKIIPYYHALGMIYLKKGDLPTSEVYYKKADSLITIKQKFQKAQLFDFDVRDELAYVHLQGGHFSEAKNLLDNTAMLRSKRYNKHNPMRFRSDLYYGYYYFEQEMPDSAYFHLERYILSIRNTRFTRKTDLNRMGSAYTLLSEICQMKNDVPNALVFAKRSYQINKHKWTKSSGGKNTFNKIASANEVAHCYRLSGDTKKALRWNDKAYKLYNAHVFIGNHQKIPILINRAMILWSMDSMASAKKYFLESSQLILDHIYLNFKFMSEYEREYFYKHHKKNIDVIKSFFYHYRCSGKDTSSYFAQEIFKLNLNTKGILLSASNRFMEKIASNSDPELAKVYKEWRDLKNELAYLLSAKEYQKSINKINTLNTRIGEKEKILQQRLQGGQDVPLAMSDVQKSIPEGSDLIEIMRVFKTDTIYIKTKKDSLICLNLSEQSAYVYFFLHAGTSDFEVECRPNGNDMDGKYLKAYRNDVFVNNRMQALYNAYFLPLKNNIHNKEIFISADGVFHLINMNTLFDRESNSYVIDNYDIKPLISSKEFIKGEIPPVKIEKVILYGRPDFGNTSGENAGQTRGIIRTFVPDLPGTEKEVNNIREILQSSSSQVEVVTGINASEENVKNIQSATVLHFATHGYFAQRANVNPMLSSGLLLSGVNEVKGSRKEDGVLTAYEASLLDLHSTRIVVLSACETGLGEIKDGEGVFGLQRAFEVAGVDYIIMSLWKVDDEVTSLLMTKFYQYLSWGEDVPQAFYKAQLEIKKKYISAKYWGAFILLER